MREMVDIFNVLTFYVPIELHYTTLSHCRVLYEYNIIIKVWTLKYRFPYPFYLWDLFIKSVLLSHQDNLTWFIHKIWKKLIVTRVEVKPFTVPTLSQPILPGPNSSSGPILYVQSCSETISQRYYLLLNLPQHFLLRSATRINLPYKRFCPSKM
jgi:hypothetical protein